jgi:hypothetical protein
VGGEGLIDRSVKKTGHSSRANSVQEVEYLQAHRKSGMQQRLYVAIGVIQ